MVVSQNRQYPVCDPECALGVPAVVEAPRVVVFDPDLDGALALVRQLRDRAPSLGLVVVTARHTPMDGPIDVGIIALADGRFDGLAFAGDLGSRDPGVQTVFWVDEGDAAASAAARSVGLQRLVPRDALAGWLRVALPGLAGLARAQRAQVLAERSVPPLPVWRADPVTTPLPVAERTFRETYLRSLLLGSANYVAAARKAGLPYTTFCSMLKKLDLL